MKSIHTPSRFALYLSYQLIVNLNGEVVHTKTPTLDLVCAQDGCEF